MRRHEQDRMQSEDVGRSIATMSSGLLPDTIATYLAWRNTRPERKLMVSTRLSE